MPTYKFVIANLVDSLCDSVDDDLMDYAVALIINNNWLKKDMDIFN